MKHRRSRVDYTVNLPQRYKSTWPLAFAALRMYLRVSVAETGDDENLSTRLPPKSAMREVPERHIKLPPAGRMNGQL